MRKFLFAGAMSLALVASFAFKTVAKMQGENVTFWIADYPMQCANGVLDDNPSTWDCSRINSGAQCTVFDWISSGGPYVPAYTDHNGEAPCTYPLFHEF